MKTLSLSFLTIVIQLVLSTYPDACYSSVLCKFVGANAGYDYEFNVNDVQNELKGCDIIVYGTYFFDVDPAISATNEKAIMALTSIGKTVYIGLRYWSDDWGWLELLNPPENGEEFNKKMDALVKFLNTHKISGVIMKGLPFYRPDSQVTAQNIVDFTIKLKEKVKDNLKVGMIILGYDYQQFSNNTALDYRFLNTEIDLYVIDLTVSNYCNNKTKHSTINPIKSNDTSLLTLEEQSIAVSKSAMEKSKVVAMLQVNTILSENYYRPQYDGDVEYGSYSQLCSFTKNGDIVKWCSDYTETLYQQGNFATQYYSGILLSVLEGDDPRGKCNCGPFIVSKAIISGWKSEVDPTCKKLDELMKIVE